MPPRIRFLYSTMMVTFFLIWWTPRTMLVPLADSGDRVEIYARGRPLTALLEAGQIRLAGDVRTGVLTPGEVGLRFNNWDRVRAERLPLLLVSAAGCGVTALMFLLVLTGRLVYRGEKETNG